jgi:uncharacterized protein YecE (DUF72 family)
MAMGRIRVGISGWRYPPWRGSFYPKGLAQKHELAWAASVLPVIEINGTFYSLQGRASFRSWYRQTPDDFVFSVKGSRFITHVLRLRDVEMPLANFFASGLLELRGKLGPILWQFPPNFPFDEQRMRAFLGLLPATTKAAARLARRHDKKIRGGASVSIDADRPLRHAIEVRHASFEDEAFVGLLREHGVGLCIAETARRWPMFHDVTADFVYMRLHGDKELYRSGYSDRSLERWARRIRAWQKGGEPTDAKRVGKRATRAAAGRDVYCFFDNTDVKLRAPFDAQSLMEKLGVRWTPTGQRPSVPRSPVVRRASPSRPRPRAAR